MIGQTITFLLKRVGVDLTPIYINMVRDPLERLVSHYYFLRYIVFIISHHENHHHNFRYGDDVLVNKVRAKEGDTTTFDECVEKKLSPDCDPRRMWIQVTFHCL